MQSNALRKPSADDLCYGESPQSIEEVLAGGLKIIDGSPVGISDFDGNDDTIIFAYDSNRVSNPIFTLIDGDYPGDKILLLNGKRMVLIEDADSLELSDIMTVESPSLA